MTTQSILVRPHVLSVASHHVCCLLHIFAIAMSSCGCISRTAIWPPMGLLAPLHVVFKRVFKRSSGWHHLFILASVLLYITRNLDTIGKLDKEENTSHRQRKHLDACRNIFQTLLPYRQRLCMWYIWQLPHPIIHKVQDLNSLSSPHRLWNYLREIFRVDTNYREVVGGVSLCREA